jgi:hypothetical protein
VSVPGGTYESVSPLVKAILAVAAGGERYRPGHYGAITKVRARGNVTGHGNLAIYVAESHEAEMPSIAFSRCLFRKPILRRFGCPRTWFGSVGASYRSLVGFGPTWVNIRHEGSSRTLLF